MVYLGHFSFASHPSYALGRSGAWHGYFMCVAEADTVEVALEKFEALLRRLHQSSSIFSDVKEVYLDSCIEIRSIPKRGFLSHYCETRGECQERIATSLAGIGRQQAIAYEVTANSGVSKGEGLAMEPFLTLQ